MPKRANHVPFRPPTNMYDFNVAFCILECSLSKSLHLSAIVCDIAHNFADDTSILPSLITLYSNVYSRSVCGSCFLKLLNRIIPVKFGRSYAFFLKVNMDYGCLRMLSEIFALSSYFTKPHSLSLAHIPSRRPSL
jgi:hypothetical protein